MSTESHEILPAGTEVTVTVTGRLVDSSDHTIVVEYLTRHGFKRRVAFDPFSTAVTAAQAPDPDTAEVQARADADLMMGSLCDECAADPVFGLASSCANGCWERATRRAAEAADSAVTQ